MKKPDSIEKRIKDAEDALLTYPSWVRENNYFQGGETLRASVLEASAKISNGKTVNLSTRHQSRSKHFKVSTLIE